MRKLMMVAAMLAVVLVVALPAIAQEVQAPTQTFVSGQNANQGGSVQSSGNSSNTCAAQENFNNSGGVLNQQSLQQYGSAIGTGNVFLGPSFANAPAQAVPCEQSVQQAASSSSGT